MGTEVLIVMGGGGGGVYALLASAKIRWGQLGEDVPAYDLYS